jgi:hypothetical protein
MEIDVMEWQKIETAPRDGTAVIVLTVDGEIAPAKWDALVPSFYKNIVGSASYEEGAMGDWVYLNHIGRKETYDEHFRLYCGQSPDGWVPMPTIGKRLAEDVQYHWEE